MGSEVYFFVFYTDFCSDVVPVKLYSFWRQIQHLGNFFGGFALSDEIGDLDLGGIFISSRNGISPMIPAFLFLEPCRENIVIEQDNLLMQGKDFLTPVWISQGSP